MWKYTYSLWISLSAGILLGQKKDTLPRLPALQGNWLSIEAGGVAKDLWCKCGRATDVNIGLVHKRFLLEFSGGVDRRTERPIRKEPRREDELMTTISENNSSAQEVPLSYLNEGYFLRSGLALRISSSRTTNWLSGLGIAYGYATYREETQAAVNSVLYDDQVVLQAQEELAVRWWELYFRLQTRLWKNIIVGYRAFAVLNQDILGEERIQSAYAPGRRTFKTQLGISYYITYYFNWIKRKDTR